MNKTNKIETLLSDYKIEGIFFTLFYIFSTGIFPTGILVKSKRIKEMGKLSIFIWFSLLLLWQFWIVYSIWVYLDGDIKTEDSDYYTYKLFVEGGWYNFQKWLSYYAQDIFEDMLFLAFILVLPLQLFDKVDGDEKVKLIFVKIGLFLLFTYFILGPPQYNIQKQDFTISNYLNQVLKFKGDIKKGYPGYFLNNKEKIIKILSSFILIFVIYRS